MTLHKLLFAIFIFTAFPTAQGQEVMRSSLDKIPASWKGKRFDLNKNYPSKAAEEAQPWKKFDFKTQPEAYINAVKQYVLEGNLECDWVFQKNKVRQWYHAPGMVWGQNGREFINGLTRERSSRPFELHPKQTNSCQNWAVGFYNPKGGVTLGKVFADPNNPNAAAAVFPEGTVTAKLLFTNASPQEVPYIANSFEWQANIHTAQRGTNDRSPATVRLLQVDIAVKDSRATNTDWVMMTFAYHQDAPGQTPWDKLVPVGVQWGNDPTVLTPGKPIVESWINPQFKKLFTVGTWSMHTGRDGRLNGPVDNPQSSCLSCHGTAQDPAVSTGMIPGNDPASLKRYFRNINPPAVFEDKPNVKEISLDYSLQLQVGIPLARNHAPKGSRRGVSGPPLDSVTVQGIQRVFLTTRDFEDEENEPVTPSVPQPSVPTDSQISTPASETGGGGTSNSDALALAALGAGALGAGAYALRRRKRNAK
jgi:hypothetical protein